MEDGRKSWNVARECGHRYRQDKGDEETPLDVALHVLGRGGIGHHRRVVMSGMSTRFRGRRRPGRCCLLGGVVVHQKSEPCHSRREAKLKRRDCKTWMK